MVTVAVIPARGGSRGLRQKNLRALGGEPMIAHTIRAAMNAEGIDRVVVSTEDQAIADVSRRCGAEVPFRRPAELALDSTPTEPVIEHAIRFLEAAGEIVDVVVTLQPTSPLRPASEIEKALGLLASLRARSVVSVTPIGFPASTIGLVVGGRFQVPRSPAGADRRRQASPPAMRLTGAIYVTLRSLLSEGRLLDDEPAALVTSGPSTIDIDDLDDLRAARRALARLEAETRALGSGR